MYIVVDKSLIEYAKNDLNEIKYLLANIKVWNAELELIEEGNIPHIDTDVHTLKTKIEDAESKIKQMNVYINQLDPEEAELIRLRYFTKNKKNLSFDRITKKMHYCKSKLKKMNDDAINLIAYNKYEIVGNSRYNKHENEMRTNQEQNMNTMRTKRVV